MTRIYHWFRCVQLRFIISKSVLSVHVIYQKCVIFIFQIWIFHEMRDSHNVSKIGLIFSTLSKSACGGLVRQVRHFVQPCSTNCINALTSTCQWLSSSLWQSQYFPSRLTENDLKKVQVIWNIWHVKSHFAFFFFFSKLWQNFHTSRKWDLKSQQPSRNSAVVYLLLMHWSYHNYVLSHWCILRPFPYSLLPINNHNNNNNIQSSAVITRSNKTLSWLYCIQHCGNMDRT